MACARSVPTRTLLLPHALWLAVVCSAATRPALSGEPPQMIADERRDPAPQQDDATLRDVAWASAACLWAVGDRGAIWTSADAGETWRFVSLPPALERFNLHSVCFLTDKVGWIAGGTILPQGGAQQGIVLHTLDGGTTWSVLPLQRLPYLKYVRFFDLEQGIAVGERSLQFPAGALQTEDGGQTWTPVNASRSDSWNTAAFLSPSEGILAGNQGRHAVAARGAIRPGGPAVQGLRAFHGLSLAPGGQAWLAGDGGSLFHSPNGGVSWRPVDSQLPDSLADLCDFHGVTHLGHRVWVAGQPGTVIWHSPDAGQSWTRQPTGDPIPLRAIRFNNENSGAAVGELGRICVTRDGGRTWQNVRGGGRQLACLAWQTDVRRIPLSFLTRWSREDGYRSATILLTRPDMGEDAHAARQLDLSFSQAVLIAGGNHASIDWRLPIALPGLRRDRSRLIAEWTLLTDRPLEEMLLESLVADIRTWRPQLVLIDEPAEGEFAAELIQRAVERAIALAPDPAFAPDQLALAGLQPWGVRKLVLQRRDGMRSSLSQEPFEVLPRLGTTLDVAVTAAGQCLNDPQLAAAGRKDYLVQLMSNAAGLSDRALLSDLGIPPGAPSRRPVPAIQSANFERLAGEVSHRKKILAISERMGSSPQQSAQLLGQLKEIVAPLSPSQAAQQLSDLGRQYQVRGEWALAEAVYAELVTRFPQEPASAQAMLWLMQFWNSAEMNWQRLRTVQASKTQNQVAPSAGPNLIPAGFEPPLIPPQEESVPFTPSLGDLKSVVTADGQAGNPYQMQLARWQALAAAMAGGLRDLHPQLFEDPQTQFVAASLYRRRNDPRRADEIYASFMRTLSDDPWNLAARGEVYLLRPGPQSPKPVIVCQRTRLPPVLDGQLSDPCWVQAAEVRLGDRSNSETFVGAESASADRPLSGTPQPIVLFAHDDRFLYFAASVPIHSRLRQDGPQLPGRVHDADLDLFDHLSLQFDVDRDYATYYRFDVDQRGWTREACWDNWSYNPQWYCAAARTSDAWRVECAIPLEQLLPPERIAGTTWAVGITRIMPGIGSQSWTNSGASIPQPPRFGLMRLE